MEGPLHLTAAHHTHQFCSGKPVLDDWLKKHAFSGEKSGGTRTYVVTDDDTVIAYYSVAYGSVEAQTAPERITKGMGKYPVPVLLLARLAVDRKFQGRGIGPALLKDALMRAVGASETAGLRAVLVHALDQEAKEFYLKFDFQEFPSNDLHLILLMKDIRRTLNMGF